MTTNYQKYPNEDLMHMIDELRRAKVITDDDADKFEDSLYKRHHDKSFTNPEQIAEAQKENVRKYYLRKKLLKIYNKYTEDNSHRLIYY